MSLLNDLILAIAMRKIFFFYPLVGGWFLYQKFSDINCFVAGSHFKRSWNSFFYEYFYRICIYSNTSWFITQLNSKCSQFFSFPLLFYQKYMIVYIYIYDTNFLDGVAHGRDIDFLREKKIIHTEQSNTKLYFYVIIKKYNLNIKKFIKSIWIYLITILMPYAT